ncbi:AEC family transporter [Mucilaginibacter sp. BT774]|uniref:AEC family transporter n=1 Tax=Mucilaginibacter sp. BT774 TaxID=3062276 RepID=UPI002677303A|nr:AEC family transporter [Mucilaginibacter sp. BT774]MDO3627924.1 AEC family transporter [Mucilaginibacter sp. BT774]
MMAGVLFRLSRLLPAEAHKGISAWIIYLALPAVSFKYLPHIHWSSQLLLPALMPVIVWLGGWVFIRLYSSRSKLGKPTEGALKLSSGLSNTSFVGFPLIMAYFSDKELGIGVICDQVTFMVLSTAGVLVAINASQKRELSLTAILKKVLRFPPFLGCVGALTIPHLIDISPLNPMFDKLALTVAPLALFSIGLQLKFDGWKNDLKHVGASMTYKLLIAPALVLGVALLMGLKGMIPQIAIFEAAMPTLLTSGVVAEEYNVNPKLSSLVIGISILVAFATTSLWYHILQILQ